MTVTERYWQALAGEKLQVHHRGRHPESVLPSHGKELLRARALPRLARPRGALDRVHRRRATGTDVTFARRRRHAIGPTATPIQVYGAWHCGNDFCTWGAERNLTEFDSKNHWLIDRGDGRPSVNLVVLSFVHPYRLLKKTTDAQTLNGIPRGMTPAIVNYFKSRGIRVMLSIGGITYVSAWNQALAENATQLGLNAAEVASTLGVGIEIDYEERPPAGHDAAAGVHRRLPLGASLRRDGRESSRPADDRPGGGGSLADRPDDQGDEGLASDGPAGAGLRQRDGPVKATDGRGGNGELAGTHRRQAAVRTADSAAGAGEVHRQPVHRRRRQGHFPSASTTPSRCSPRRGASWRACFPTERGSLRACSATCSGPRSDRPREGSGRCRPIRARTGTGAGATALNVPIPMPALRTQ